MATTSTTTVNDIQYDMLPEWLTQRAVVSTSWLKQSKRLRIQIHNAQTPLLNLLQTLTDKEKSTKEHPALATTATPAPAALDDGLSLLRDVIQRCSLPTLSDPTGHLSFSTHCLYVDSQYILQLLLTKVLVDEATSKSFLGYYNHPILHQWDEIVRTYATQHLHLADTARAMVQDCKVSFISPCLRQLRYLIFSPHFI